MKIRHGFVSNSSTTSFCIYGARVETPYDEEKEIQAEESGEYYDSEEDMYEMCEKIGLEHHSPPYGDGDSYVGLSWDSIRDDETGAQFKARVEAQLFTHFRVEPCNCRTHEEAWRDG